jgi:hypothetical protein
VRREKLTDVRSWDVDNVKLKRAPCSSDAWGGQTRCWVQRPDAGLPPSKMPLRAANGLT